MAGTLPFSYKLNPQLLKIFELNSALFHSTSFYFKNRGTMQIYRRRYSVLDMWWSVTDSDHHLERGRIIHTRLAAIRKRK